MAELRSCNRGFHNVGIDSLFAILLPRHPSLPSRLSLLVFPKIRFKGVYPAGCEKKKKKEKRAGWSSHLVKAFWTAKKKKEKETKLLSPLAVNVIRPDFTLSQFSLMSKKIEPITTVSFSLSLSPQHFDRFVLTSIMRSSILLFYI